MTDSGETPEQAAARRREELLRDMDHSIEQTAKLIASNSERYLPPYSGQKPRETPAPDRTPSPERQDPDLPPKEKQPPPVRDVPEPEQERNKAMEFNSPEWRAAQAAQLAEKGVTPEAAQAQALGLLGNAHPPSAAVERRPPNAPERTGQERDTPGQGQERTR